MEREPAAVTVFIQLANQVAQIRCCTFQVIANRITDSQLQTTFLFDVTQAGAGDPEIHLSSSR